ncbi:MAG: MaoC/PaaZ C-terminal domain-containing protein [Dermatophilus congolensis]|nr:MaoC/PaaZ C-terminal domain-containing protein [Dermatophilus congolensis]
MSNAEFDISALSVGDALPGRTVEIDRERVVAYAAASGDHNRIHWDDEFARSVGLPGVIGHGMLTMASAVAMVEDWAGDRAYLADYRTKFVGFVPIPFEGVAVVDVAGTIKSIDLEARTVVVELTVTHEGAKVLGNARGTVTWH